MQPNNTVPPATNRSQKVKLKSIKGFSCTAFGISLSAHISLDILLTNVLVGFFSINSRKMKQEFIYLQLHDKLSSMEIKARKEGLN